MTPTTGWSAPELLQDECYELFAWFASKPDARRLVREHCARIAQQLDLPPVFGRQDYGQLSGVEDMDKQQALGNAQRLREVATMLRSSGDGMDADAAVDCDRAAKFLEDAATGRSRAIGQLSGLHMSDVHIEPCPFCHSSAHVEALAHNSHRVECDSCGAIGPTGSATAMAIADWNHRPRDAAATGAQAEPSPDSLLGAVQSLQASSDRLTSAIDRATTTGAQAEAERLRAGLETLLQSDGTWRSTDDAMRAIEQRVAALLAAATGAQAEPLTEDDIEEIAAQVGIGMVRGNAPANELLRRFAERVRAHGAP